MPTPSSPLEPDAAREPVRLECEGALARVRLNRPHVLNAGDAEWVRALGAVVRELGRRPEVRVVVITGAGRAFSTGVDLTALAHGDVTLDEFRAWEDAMTALERLPALVLAGINGHCLGGGLQLALVCDYRLAAESALIGLPAVKECLIPSMALYRLPRLIGMARAQELILLGDPIRAREAERYGLVHRVVPDGEFPAALEALVERGLALPAASLAASKQLLARAFDRDFVAFRAEMEARFRECLASGDHHAAMDEIRKRTSRAPGP
ncbi:MAG: enoyl-CoA hydratase/isomerase family protein [Candidatus Rokubacteria bacterium]|nr:enoyl-CoA hydratase/isomerase family protein [Candidatus Rokubacteria bacterium]